MGGVLLMSIVYAAFTMTQYFRDQPRWKTVLRVVLGFGLFMFAQAAVMYAAAFAVTRLR